jgi:hypothetical protein
VVAASSTNSSRWHFLVFTAFAQASGAGTFSPIASSVTDLGLGVLGFLARKATSVLAFHSSCCFSPLLPIISALATLWNSSCCFCHLAYLKEK